MLAFDLLIFNVDRKTGDVLSLTGGDVFSSEPIAIDHSNALTGANWTTDNLVTNHDSLIDGGLSAWIYRLLRDERLAKFAAEGTAEVATPQIAAIQDLLYSVNPLSAREHGAVADLLDVRSSNLIDLCVRHVKSKVGRLT
jgi:hypothetical protein